MPNTRAPTSQARTPDYVIVGGGAGGAVLAARLAEMGRTVSVIEAGGDPLENLGKDGSDMPLSEAYRVPAFHAFASEHKGMAHDYWVRHYADDAQQKRDWRYDAAKNGILYPRVSGLGGCSSHHAMIIVRPNDCDWNHIWQLTGDDSWKASHMQGYFERIERCRYRFFLWRWLAALTGLNPTGHGWWGWMQTERALPLRAIRDWPLTRMLLRSIGAAADAFIGPRADWSTTGLDPNARRVWAEDACGVRIAPLSTRNHTRHGPRERLLDVMQRLPDRVSLHLHTRAERVEIVDGVAIAVHCRRADGSSVRIAAAREVILAGGAFATPQLMMLSGLGDAAALQALGIPVVADLPGVGRNLQDRYEIAVVNRMKTPWSALRDVTYSVRDRPYKLWKWFRQGMYTSNGILFSLALKSDEQLAVPDLHCFSLLADFRGYYQGYSERLREHDYMTWVVLKAYTENRGGTVTLRSTDPGDAPAIDFHSFHEGTGDADRDLDAIAMGVRFIRKVDDAIDPLIAEEVEPGREIESDQDLKRYIADNAWGHHACGTCAIGPRDQGGVLDSHFRVHGVKGLRVVDASVFPRIPGYFLAAAVYMIAEKAADCIVSDP